MLRDMADHNKRQSVLVVYVLQFLLCFFAYVPKPFSMFLVFFSDNTGPTTTEAQEALLAAAVIITWFHFCFVLFDCNKIQQQQQQQQVQADACLKVRQLRARGGKIW